MALIFFDNFHRANSSGLGTQYTSYGNGESDFNVSSNTATPSSAASDCGDTQNAVTVPNNCRIALALATACVQGAATATDGIGVIFRTTSASNKTYRFVCSSDAGSSIALNNAGSFSTLASNTGTLWATGDTVVIYVAGSTFSVYRIPSGGTIETFIYSATDSTLASGGAGLGYSSSCTTAGNVASFSIDDQINGPRSVGRPGLRLGTPLSRLRSSVFDSTDTNVSITLSGQVIASTEGALSSIVSTDGQTLRGAPGLRLGTPLSRLRSSVFDSTDTNVSTSLSGQLISSTLGTITATISYALTGQAIASTEGTIGPTISSALVGQAIVSSEGTLSASLNYSIIGQSIASSEGTITSSGGGAPVVTAAGRHRKLFGVWDGDKLLVFDSKRKADAAKAAIAQRNRPRRRLNIAQPPPHFVIETPHLMALAEVHHEAPRLRELLISHQPRPLIEFYHDLKRKQDARDEEEIAMILLHL